MLTHGNISTVDALTHDRNEEGADQLANREKGGLQTRESDQTTATGGNGHPSLRLDMDLDVDIQLKAKIEGDVTLALL